MSGSSYFNLLRDNALRKYAGLTEEVVKEKSIYSKDYTYQSFGLDKARSGGKSVKTVKAGETLTLTANCGSLKVHRYKVIVEPHPDMFKLGLMSWQRLWEDGDEGEIKIGLLALTDFSVSEIKELVRLYVQS